MKKLGLFLLLFEFNHFSFLIDIVDNIIDTVYFSRDTDGDTWRWYCSAIGMGYGHMIQTYLSYYQLYQLKIKNY